MFLRSDLEKVSGGPNVQAMAYVDYLRRHGVEVHVWPSDRVPQGHYDIGHLLNLDWPLETAIQYRAARASCDRVLLSTIHHRDDWIAALHTRARRGVAARVASLTSIERYEGLRNTFLSLRHPRRWREAGRQLRNGVRMHQRRLLQACDGVLTLAEGEIRSLADDFGTTGKRGWHVPNGAVLADPKDPPAGLPEQFLLCVGRIEARKNQLALIDAARSLDLPVVLAGAPNPRHRALVAAVEERARESDVIWFPSLDHNVLASLYRKTACHVLPSWCEVVPLVDLEAAVNGAPVVTTTRGYSGEYLGDGASYWDPGSSTSLERLIAAALQQDRPVPRTVEDLGWDRAGERLMAAYEDVLAA